MKSIIIALIAAMLAMPPAQAHAASRVTASPSTGAEVSPKGETVDELLARMEARAAEWQDYTVSGESETHGKPSHFKLYFKQPDLVRIDTHRGQVTVQPNGEIRGRRGHGLFGHISRQIKRDDSRLKDADGRPFWDSSYSATLTLIRSRIKEGAIATVSTEPAGLQLELRSGLDTWRYVIDPDTLFFHETTHSKEGEPLQVTHYTDFRANVGLEPHVFEF
jgi:outer membrane lipoprotein-sorting protein